MSGQGTSATPGEGQRGRSQLLIPFGHFPPKTYLGGSFRFDGDRGIQDRFESSPPEDGEHTLEDPHQGPQRRLKTAELMKARDALRTVASYFGGTYAAKLALVDLIKDGDLNAYARQYWTTSIKSHKKAWDVFPLEGVITRKKIRSGVLSGASSLYEDAKRWKWPKGDFHVVHKKSGNSLVRHMYRDVRFRRDEIERLVSETKAALRARGPGGRHFKEGQWGMVWRCVAKLAQAGSLTCEHFENDRMFIKRVYEDYKKISPTSDRLSITTVEPQLKLSYKILILGEPESSVFSALTANATATRM
jgi:hypothetical protein